MGRWDLDTRLTIDWSRVVAVKRHQIGNDPANGVPLWATMVVFEKGAQLLLNEYELSFEDARNSMTNEQHPSKR